MCSTAMALAAALLAVERVTPVLPTKPPARAPPPYQRGNDLKHALERASSKMAHFADRVVIAASFHGEHVVREA